MSLGSQRFHNDLECVLVVSIKLCQHGSFSMPHCSLMNMCIPPPPPPSLFFYFTFFILMFSYGKHSVDKAGTKKSTLSVCQIKNLLGYC